MSWVFLAGDRVLKLKKPVRYPFLDFSTLAAREHDCREELRLNRRLAPDVYLGLVALQQIDGGLALVPEARAGTEGRTLDWLVLMRRLPADRMLDRLLAGPGVTARELDALADLLVRFYREAPRAAITAQDYLARFRREQAITRDVLLRPDVGLDGVGPVLDRLDTALDRHGELLLERARAGRVLDGHGDLRPEHVCLLSPPVVIDALEFNRLLRAVDPFDELSLLGLECAVAGAAWVGPHLIARCGAALGDTPPPALLALYSAYRALLRARLAAAHLLDPQCRSPERWPAQARRYAQAGRRWLDTLDGHRGSGGLNAAMPPGNP
jgi:aminoglycoside phosphotransferase family enzyme